MTPNDPKLSDGGAWRGSCEGGAQKEATSVGQRHGRTGREQARIAATVTRGAVRCSAWLGVRSDLRQRWRVAAKRRVKVRAALCSAASGRLRCSDDGNGAEGGWGAGRKLPAKRTDSRTKDVERGCAADSESEAQTGTKPLIAAKDAAWPKPDNSELSKLVRHAARADALASPTDVQATSD